MVEIINVTEICKLFDHSYCGNMVDIDGLNLVGRDTSKESVLSYVTGRKYKRKVENDNSIRALIVSDDDAELYE